MRFTLILLLSLLPSFAFSAPKTLGDFLKESQEIRKGLEKEKDFKKKIDKLNLLETSLKTTIKDYERQNPQEGAEAEGKVHSFLLSLSPISKILQNKPTAKNCEKTRYRINFEERGSSPENIPLSEEAQEAMAWVDLLCN